MVSLMCRVQKLFRIRIKNEIEIRKAVKLSDRKIRWIVTHCHIRKDVSTKEAAVIYGVSVRRTQQIVKAYKETGKSRPKSKKERRRKRTRYERNNSGSLLHGDWHRSDETKPYAIVWMDDASRKILGYGEFEKATTENSIQTLEMALAHASEYKIVIKECEIKHIVSRKNNPQTNCKVERFLIKEDRIDGNSTA